MIIMYVHTIYAINIYLVNTYIPQYLLFILHVVKAHAITAHWLFILSGKNVQWLEVGTLPFAKLWWHFRVQGGHVKPVSILTVFSVAVNRFEVHKLYVPQHKRSIRLQLLAR